jgi:DNA-binding NtrC family response regulator
MKTILVIDDEKGMRKALDRQLRRAGYRVLLAESGQQALDLLREEAVDLILLDHQLPDMNGLDVFEQMQERRLIDGVSVGMMTAYGSIPLATAFMSKGGDFFVEKPFYPPGILEVTIARELNIAEATRKQVEARTAELNRLKEQAESANRLKSRILENIEHQVRTPLSVAMGYAELLSGAQMPEKTRQMAASLYDALQSLHRLLEGIWRVSRLQSGEPIKTETVALETCIDALHYRRRAE